MKYLQAFGVLLIVCAIAFLAGKANEPSWEVSSFEYQGQKATGYSLNLPNLNASCRVNVYANETMEAHGHDNNWYGKSVSDSIRLEKKDGQTLMSRHISNHTQDNGTGFIMIHEGGYHVFYVKCVPYAHLLPQEVQKKFRGWLGIK